MIGRGAQAEGWPHPARGVGPVPRLTDPSYDPAVGRQHLAASVRALREVLAKRELRRAELAFLWALTGEWALTVALAVVAFDDGGAAGVGLVAVLRMVPSAIGTPFITAFADRTRRERALAAISLLRVVTIGTAAILLAVDATHVLVYALVVVATIAFTAFRPAHSSLLPLLCTTTDELTGANVVRGLLGAAATLTGPAVAGVLLAWSSPSAVFGAAAVASLLAAVLLLRIRYDAPEPTVPVERDHLVAKTVDGLRTVSSHPDLRWIFGIGLAQTYVRGALNVFTVVLALEVLDLGDPGVAGLSAAVGVGGLLGSLGVSLLSGSRHLGAWFAIALFLWGAPIAVIGMAPGTVLAYGLIAVVGVANAVIDIPIFTLPVRLVPDDVLTRVFGLFESVVAVGVALGSAITPAVISGIGIDAAMVVTGLLLPVLAVLAWRPLTRLDGRLAVRDDGIAVLRSAAMLQLLPVPSIEYLATHAVERRVPAGATVIRQGEPGDAFFVIADGEAEVLADGALLHGVGPGEAFGEVALLEDVPRTATVRATTDLRVLEIARDDFLDVVTGHRTTRDAADGVVAAHLGRIRSAAVGP
jgi:predicted MFS family arabinose efflux permease